MFTVISPSNKGNELTHKTTTITEAVVLRKLYKPHVGSTHSLQLSELF